MSIVSCFWRLEFAMPSFSAKSGSFCRNFTRCPVSYKRCAVPFDEHSMTCYLVPMVNVKHAKPRCPVVGFSMGSDHGKGRMFSLAAAMLLLFLTCLNYRPRLLSVNIHIYIYIYIYVHMYIISLFCIYILCNDICIF